MENVVSCVTSSGEELGVGQSAEYQVSFTFFLMTSMSEISNRRLAFVIIFRFLKGHTGFCTTLKLSGNKLISGSYDEYVILPLAHFGDLKSLR